MSQPTETFFNVIGEVRWLLDCSGLLEKRGGLHGRGPTPNVDMKGPSKIAIVVALNAIKFYTLHL